ncbi:unnamed protein product [Symbiodinium sp. KB8]|nr:unnamed protein product [Symbiodinium sp. KB8]
MSAGGHHASLLEFGKEIFVQHDEAAAFLVLSMVMIAMVMAVAPKWQQRHWGRNQEAEEPVENQNTENQTAPVDQDKVFKVDKEIQQPKDARPNSEDDEAAANEAYVQTYVADGEDVERGHGTQGSASTQLPLVPGRVYMIGEPHKKKAYRTFECGMVQKWMRDLPSNVREVTKQYAMEKKLKACKQCRP